MPDAVFHFALKDTPRLVSVRGDIEAQLGYSRRDFLAARASLKNRIHAEDAHILDSLFSSHIADQSGTFNIRLRHADGRIRCIKGQYTRKSGRARGEVRLTLILQDARKVDEPGDAILLASFKTLIEHTRDFIYVKNRNHVILAASRSLPNLTESARNPAELAGKTDYDLHPEPIADAAYRLEKQAIAEGRRTNEFQRLPAQDGTIRWLDNRKYPISSPGGEIIGIFGVAPDITEHIKAEQKLRESEERLREAQTIAKIGSFVLDIPTMTWEVSPELDALMGIDAGYPRALEGLWPLIHPDDRAAVEERLNAHCRGEGEPREGEYRIVRKNDGAIRWVHAHNKLEFDAQGTPVALHGTVQDITERKLADAALRENKDLLQLFIEHAPVALAMLDREMRYLATSRRFVEEFSLAGQEIIGSSHYEVFPLIPESWKEYHRSTLAGEAVHPPDDILPAADGGKQWLHHELRPWFTANGSVGGIVIFVQDITGQKLNEERLRLAATVFNGARESIMITDPKGIVLDVNDTFTRVTGYSREESVGMNIRTLKAGAGNDDPLKNIAESLYRDGRWSGEHWSRTKNGDLYAEMVTINAMHDAAGKIVQFVGLATDITEIKKHEQQLEHIAHYDALTGLPNRTMLADRIRQAMAQAHRSKQFLAVAYLDLDGFKTVNDNYGHAIGDALLTALAYRMKRVLREGDTLARLGGDEFVAVMLDLADAEAGAPTLNHLLEAAAKGAQIGDYTLRVSASAGVAFYPQIEEVDADMLLRQAGQALYEAKLGGKNRYCVFDPSRDKLARSHYENIERLRHALAAREFVLYYQPKVNMRTGELIGAEALLRWQHPERGLLPPGMFLPVIENHPLTIEIGEWGIESVLTQIETWQAEGLELPVSVNMSAIELQQPDFANRLRARLAAHPLVKPSSIELEVLETTALHNMAQSSEVLTACREIGVSISIDDFGTGYSSLMYLKRLPTNTLKIDQSFVRDMLDEPENLTIIEGVLGLATAFHRQVIAEGVETVDHGVMLLQMGCDFAQGYCIARPMPAGDLHAWASSWRPDPRWTEAPPVHAENQAVLYAIVELRAWFGAVEAYLQGRRKSPPPLDLRECRLGMWLDTAKRSSRRMLPTIQALDTLHKQFHALAAQICGLQAQGRSSEAAAHLRELHYLHEKCRKRLIPFARAGSGQAGKDNSRHHGIAESIGASAD